MRICIAFSLILLSAITGCKNRAAESSSKNSENTVNINPAAASDITGLYTGDFGGNKITVVIDKATDSMAEGKTITGNNERQFEGKLKQENDRIVVSAHEAGNTKTDGVFQFYFDPKNKQALSGSWKPYNTDAGIASKSFILNRKLFIYRNDVGDFPQASTKLLRDDDLNNLLEEELIQMRNEIFARHGYSFAESALRQQFESRDWYVAYSINVTKSLTAIEKANLLRIKRFESYAKQHVSDFGR